MPTPKSHLRADYRLERRGYLTYVQVTASHTARSKRSRIAISSKAICATHQVAVIF
ncbi:hypothetical protein [Scytonema hofmannii]|uniref:hypothetical protein n=1 Tax=Scytonema hofmannii TaxID=34078 RepID=UPI0013145D12|nr:hypothetical protein [Scytonema hofmannii]